MNSKSLAYLPIAVALLFTINACKKSDNPGKFPDLKGVYLQANTEELSEPVMYTMNGKVTNQQIINSYLTKYPDFASVFVTNTSSLPNENAGNGLTFKEDGTVSAVASSGNESPPSKYTITKKSPSGFVLESLDTGRIFEGEIGGLFPNRSSILQNDINVLSRVTNCKPIPPGSGYSQVCTFRESAQFIIKNDQLYLAIISYSISTYSDYYGKSGLALGNDSGLFNTGIVSQLIAGDTIVYQAKTIMFSKQQ